MKEIANSLYYFSTEKPLICYKISYMGYCRQFCSNLCYFSNSSGFKSKRENLADVLCYLFHYSGLLLLQIIIHQWRINIIHSMLSHPVIPQHNNLYI